MKMKRSKHYQNIGSQKLLPQPNHNLKIKTIIGITNLVQRNTTLKETHGPILTTTNGWKSDIMNELFQHFGEQESFDW